ncbi:hypothetical protein JKP88DRAFT_284381 [Tribonema minus]|uniref:Uncharacterized protein n=1 Tax=Tribonema minus TaxID=303371 RepID=A0A836CP58_9STRA|nr:hypothetical protein JKP88DRAFT_284381 [Tribonema minus]
MQHPACIFNCEVAALSRTGDDAPPLQRVPAAAAAAVSAAAAAASAAARHVLWRRRQHGAVRLGGSGSAA